MKKLIYASAGIFMASLMFVSCSSDSEMLSQFSKRKYLKKFKAKNEKYEDKIEKRNNELLYVEEETYASNSNETSLIQETNLLEEELTTTATFTEEQSELVGKVNDQVKDYSSWNRYNREFSSSREYSDYSNIENKALKRSSNSDLMIVLYVILALFVAPLVVLLIEGASNRFWWTLLFWVLGFTIFAINSGGLFFLIAFILALISIIQN